MAVDEYVKLGDMLSDDGNYKIGMYYYEEYEKNDNNIFESYAKNYFSKINPASAKVHWTAKAKDVFFKLAKEETQYNSTFYYLLCELAGAKSPSIYNKLGNAYRLGYGVNADVSKAYQYYKNLVRWVIGKVFAGWDFATKEAMACPKIWKKQPYCIKRRLTWDL